MNEFQRIFRSEAFKQHAAIVTVMALATYCLASCSPFPGEKPSVGDGGGTPTMPLPNTETPTATATSTETPTPSPTATYSPDQIKQLSNTEIIGAAPEAEGLEKFISPAGKHIVLYRNDKKEYTQAYNMITKEMVDVIHVSTDWEKPTKITMEDLTSGKLADSERLQCPGFSDKVIPGDWFQFEGDKFYSGVNYVYNEKHKSDPSTRPQRMCSFSEIEADLGRGKMPYILIGVGVLNVDRTVGFFHKVARVEDLALNLENAASSYYLIMTQQLRTNDYPEKKFLMDMYPDMQEIGLELDEADILPKKLENRMIATVTSPW